MFSGSTFPPLRQRYAVIVPDSGAQSSRKTLLGALHNVVVLHALDSCGTFAIGQADAVFAAGIETSSEVDFVDAHTMNGVVADVEGFAPDEPGEQGRGERRKGDVATDASDGLGLAAGNAVVRFLPGFHPQGNLVSACRHEFVSDALWGNGIGRRRSRTEAFAEGTQPGDERLGEISGGGGMQQDGFFCSKNLALHADGGEEFQPQFAPLKPVCACHDVIVREGDRPGNMRGRTR